MKGHRRKKSSVGVESLRGQGRALVGGLCCQEGGSQELPQAQPNPPQGHDSRTHGGLCLPEVVRFYPRFAPLICNVSRT
jgi:hypothetical protein